MYVGIYGKTLNWPYNLVTRVAFLMALCFYFIYFMFIFYYSYTHISSSTCWRVGNYCRESERKNVLPKPRRVRSCANWCQPFITCTVKVSFIGTWNQRLVSRLNFHNQRSSLHITYVIYIYNYIIIKVGLIYMVDSR